MYIYNSPWPTSCNYSMHMKGVMIWWCSIITRTADVHVQSESRSILHVFIAPFGAWMCREGVSDRQRQKGSIGSRESGEVSWLILHSRDPAQFSTVPLLWNCSAPPEEGVVSSTALSLSHPALARGGLLVPSDPCPCFSTKLSYSRFCQRRPEGTEL